MTQEEILKEIDALCTKYYYLEQKDVFKDLNALYHKIKGGK